MAAPDEPIDPNAGVLLQRFKGLHNVATPERLQPDELHVALNVDIDDHGQVRRRRGYKKVLSGDMHSVWTMDDGRLIGVRNGSLVLINPDWTTVTLQTGMGSEPVAYVQVDRTVYFCSRTVSWKLNVDTLAVAPWGAEVSPGTWLSPVLRPTATLPEVRGKLLGAPPHATSLAYFNGRIYLASGPMLWATELYLYDYVDKTKSFRYYESEITGLGAVTDGVYVGTEDKIFFLDGTYHEHKRITVLDAGMIRGSLVRAQADLIKPNEAEGASFAASKNAVIFMTDIGIYAGLDNGRFYSMTPDFVFPDFVKGAAAFRLQDGIYQYIGAFDSGGTPQDSARFGDFVEADIRRPGDWGYIVDGVRFGDQFIVEKV